MSIRIILGDRSPAVKRYIAQTRADNCAGQQAPINSPGILATTGPHRLSDTVHTLAANVNRLIEREKLLRGNLTSNKKIGKAAGVSSNTVGNMRRGEGSATVVSLTKVGRVFGLKSWHLLYPGLDRDNLPEVISDPLERQVIEAFRGKPPGPPTQH